MQLVPEDSRSRDSSWQISLTCVSSAMRPSALSDSAVLVEPPADLFSAQGLDPCCRKLESQWDAVESATDLYDGQRVARREPEPRLRLHRTLYEQLHCRIEQQLVQSRGRIRFRQRERRHAPGYLANNAKWFPTGRQHA